MAKKSNEPFKQYISVANNSELYKLSSALTGKDFFTEEAIAQIPDSKKDIFLQITEYDIIQNPSIIMQTTKKEEIVNKVAERLESLDQNIRDMYIILFNHWMKNKISDVIEDKGKAFIDLDTIHFDYRGLRGKNLNSTIYDNVYQNYIHAIDVLTSTKVRIDITKETNVAYDKIKSLKWGAMEGFLINNIRLIWDEKDPNKLRGLYYDLGLIGEAYTQHVPQINNKYPTALLQLDSKNYSTAKNIGNYLCYLHRCNENTGNKLTHINFYKLLMESRYEVKAPYIQRHIDRFLKHLFKIEDVLKNNNIITNMEIPSDIHTNNYKNKQISIHWVY